MRWSFRLTGGVLPIIEILISDRVTALARRRSRLLTAFAAAKFIASRTTD
jgi:hypothetical protein